MTQESTVRQLADLLVANPVLDIAEGSRALESLGVPRALAVRAYYFTQLAWCRVALDGMGVTFSSDYLLFDGSGNVVESGKVEEEAAYVAARKLAASFQGSEGFNQLIMTAAEFKALNSALMAGSKPEDLVMVPVFISLEPLTAEGRAKFNAVVERHIQQLKP